MIKTLLLSLAILMGCTACAETQEDTQVVEETHRSLPFSTTDLAPERTFYDKCVLGCKGVGAGTVGAIFAFCGYFSTKEARLNGLFEKNHNFTDKAGVVCMTGAALFLAATMCGVSYDNIKAALKG